MEWWTTVLYVAGALTAHYIIYKDAENPDDMEHSSANMACILWPIALCIWIVLGIEEAINNVFKK